MPKMINLFPMRMEDKVSLGIQNEPEEIYSVPDDEPLPSYSQGDVEISSSRIWTLPFSGEDFAEEYYKRHGKLPDYH